MIEIVLFHHALGLTDGVHALADGLRSAGHVVHLPDLYEGRSFTTLDDGVAHAEEIGFGELVERGVRAVESLPTDVVYAGISLGVLPAQRLAQTRPGAAGALLLEACVPLTEFSERWPAGVPVQIHGMDHDPFFAGEGDVDAARALVADATGSGIVRRGRDGTGRRARARPPEPTRLRATALRPVRARAPTRAVRTTSPCRRPCRWT
ncbi:MAG: hypothetical protein MUE78_03840 [Ilumatobacteraceae bacterium]|nr:hypothetical protein [Ilumatobacteraceae bacterium]